GAARGAGDDGGVVGAVDRDGDDLGGAVHGGDREGVGQLAADIERLDCAVGIVERVAPVPGAIDRVAAIAVVAGGRDRHRREGVGRVVDVAIGESAARGPGACTLSLHDALPIYGAARGAGDDGGV